MPPRAITFTQKTVFYQNLFRFMGTKKFLNHFERKLQRKWSFVRPVLSKNDNYMEKVIIQIGASSDYFGGFAINCDGVYGSGKNVSDCKENVLEGLRLLKESRPMEQWPELLKGEYEIEFRYDVQSVLSYYANVFTKPALERLTGINQKQLHHYANGLRKPREPQRKKIENALHKLGAELLSVQL